MTRDMPAILSWSIYDDEQQHIPVTKDASQTSQCCSNPSTSMLRRLLVQAKPAVLDQSMTAAEPESLGQLRSPGSGADQPQHSSASRHSTAEASQQQPVEAGAGPRFRQPASSHRGQRQDHSQESTHSYQQTPASAHPVQVQAAQEPAPDSGSRPVAENRAGAPGALHPARGEPHASTEPATEHLAQPSQPALLKPKEPSTPQSSLAELHSSSPAEGLAHVQPSYGHKDSPHSEDGSRHSAAAGRQSGTALPGGSNQ